MNLVTVLSLPADTADQRRVYWANGVQRQGVMLVSGVDQFPQHPDGAAELAALHNLLVTRELHGSTQAGKNLVITASAPVIRKLFKADAALSDYLRLSRFLRTRFAEAQIRLSSDSSWVKPRAEERRSSLTIAASLDATAPLPMFGPVIVSEHALLRFCERSAAKDPHRAWAALTGVMQRASRLVVPTADAQRTIDDEFGRQAVLLYDQLERWQIVLTPPLDQRSLPVVASVYPVLSGNLRHEPLAPHFEQAAVRLGLPAHTS